MQSPFRLAATQQATFPAISPLVQRINLCTAGKERIKCARIGVSPEIPLAVLTSDNQTLMTMRCYVYVLGSEHGDTRRTYVGWTTDLDQRLARHNAGTGAKSTRGRVWVLLYAERYQTRSAAMSREWHLKRDRAFRKELWPNGASGA